MKLTQTLFNGPSCVFGLNLTHTGILSIMDFKYFLKTTSTYFLFFTLLISTIFFLIFDTITLTVMSAEDELSSFRFVVIEMLDFKRSEVFFLEIRFAGGGGGISARSSCLFRFLFSLESGCKTESETPAAGESTKVELITCEAADGEFGAWTTVSSSGGGEVLLDSTEDDIRGSEVIDDPERLNDVSGEGR